MDLPTIWHVDLSVAAATRRANEKPAACFARRVNLVLQKYFSFRNAEFMI
jgi:hypothetical protein